MDRAASTKRDVLECMLFDESVKPTDFPLALLEYITDGFSDDNQIGEGGFAKVYKGMLTNGSIAVKKMSKNHLYENKFNQEVECLLKAKHKNVVRFLGYCADTHGKMEMYNGKHVMAEVQQRLLCFEYLPKGSLHDFITDASREPKWTQCYQIIKGICVGLHHLHENFIIHSDLKPTNILFDDNMMPKIADFGLSRCFDESQSHVLTSKLYGTLGYIAPEVIYYKRITFKSDMFSLGVIINEILSGEKMYPEDYDVLKSWGNRLDKLHREKQLVQLRVCMEIGKECTDSEPRKRPDAHAVVRRFDEVDIIMDSRPDEADIVLTDMSNLSRAQLPGLRMDSDLLERCDRILSCSSVQAFTRGKAVGIDQQPAPGPKLVLNAAGAFLADEDSPPPSRSKRAIVFRRRFDEHEVFPEPAKRTTDPASGRGHGEIALYGEIERRLRKRGIMEPAKDLKTLKQILEGLQLKGLLYDRVNPPPPIAIMRPANRRPTQQPDPRTDRGLLERYGELLSSIQVLGSDQQPRPSPVYVLDADEDMPSSSPTK